MHKQLLEREKANASLIATMTPILAYTCYFDCRLAY